MAVNKRKILESAQKHVQKGALDKALVDYQTLLKADSKDANVRLKVGDLQLKLGRTQDAIDCYLRVAQQFTTEGFDAKAVALYKQISKLDDKRFEVHAQLGDLYQRMGLSSEAMKALQQAADGAYRAGDKPQALGLLRRMASLDPTNTASRQKVADLLRQEGRPEEAIAEYEEIVKELERQKNGEEQLKMLERLLEIAPERPETLRALSRAAAENRAWQRAESAARKLLQASPDDIDGLQLLGAAIEGAGRTSEAADVFRDVAERFRARGDEDRARELMQRYGGGGPLSVDDSEPAVIETVGDELELDADDEASLPLEDATDADSQGGDTDWLEETPTAAAPAATAAAPQPPASAAAASAPTPGRATEPEAEPEEDLEQLLAEASVLLRYGKHDRAVETLRAALRVEPGHPLALEKLGTALIASGNRPHAASALQRAAEGFANANDPEGVARVTELLAKVDPKAAAALAPPAAPPAPPEPPAPTPAAPQADDDSHEIEIDLDADLPAMPSPAASSEDGGADFSGIEIESSDLSLDDAPSEPSAGEAQALPQEFDDPAAFSFREEEPEPAPPVATAAPAAAAAQAASVDADLEEAEFYRTQGLLSEARALYERVLRAIPNHPKASLRLGEIDAAERAAQAAPSPAPASPVVETSLDLDDASDAVQPEAPAEADDTTHQEIPPVVEVKAPAPRPRPEPQAPAPPAPPAPQAKRAREADVTIPALPAEEPAPLGDFDLAAELSTIDDTPSKGRAQGTEAEGFQEVFAAFKAGVRREVGESDFEAHYDLGIAYKEMGLLDDAIGEFQTALGSESRRVACLHLMGLCALELGRANDAIAHISQALAGAALAAEQEAALRVDLGRAYAGSGDRPRARAAYQAALALDPELPGITQLIEELAAVPARATAQPPEGLESFDDLLEESAGAPAASAPSYESFDDLMSDDESAPPRAPVARSRPEPEPEAIEAEPEPELEPEPEPPPPPPRRPQPGPAASEPRPESPAPAARKKKKISFV